METKTIVALGSVVVAASFIGCGGEDKIATVLPGVDTGTLEQNWTIEGKKDPAKCQQYKADRMRVIVFDTKGAVHSTKFEPCNTFQMTLDLKTDTYTGNATFVDAQGSPVSKTLHIPAFSIAKDRRAPASVDFTPADMRP